MIQILERYNLHLQSTSNFNKTLSQCKVYLKIELYLLLGILRIEQFRQTGSQCYFNNLTWLFCFFFSKIWGFKFTFHNDVNELFLSSVSRDIGKQLLKIRLWRFIISCCLIFKCAYLLKPVILKLLIRKTDSFWNPFISTKFFSRMLWNFNY